MDTAMVRCEALLLLSLERAVVIAFAAMRRLMLMVGGRRVI